MDLRHLRASDGTGEAVLAHIQTTRTIGSTVLDLDNVDNWNAQCIVVTGTPNANGYIATAGMTVMYGHLNAGDFIIDGYAPGYSDAGNTTSQVAIVKMTTSWADTLNNILTLEHTDSGAHEANTINPTGAIIAYGGRVAPTGWLLCDGSAVSRATYAALFAAIVPNLGTFTVTIASPGVFTLNSHALKLGELVYLTTTGALPTGLAANTGYYAIPVTANTFRLATTMANAIAGTAINTSGTQSGTHSLFYAPYGMGNASTTFNVPDMRSRVLVGQGAGQFVTSFAAADVTTGTDLITVPYNKSLFTGTKVRFTTTGGLPAGLSLATDYYVIWQSNSTIKVATTLANALTGTAIDITTQGTGTHTLTQLLTDNNLGQLGGEETHALTVAEIPAHIHNYEASSADTAANGSTRPMVKDLGYDRTPSTQSAGGSGAHNITQPQNAANFIIKT